MSLFDGLEGGDKENALGSFFFFLFLCLVVVCITVVVLFNGRGCA